MNIVCRGGCLWLGRWLRIKDVRRADIVLFSDRYASWHIGPFAVRLFGWPKKSGTRERAARLDAWRSPEIDIRSRERLAEKFRAHMTSLKEPK